LICPFGPGRDAFFWIEGIIDWNGFTSYFFASLGRTLLMLAVYMSMAVFFAMLPTIERQRPAGRLPTVSTGLVRICHLRLDQTTAGGLPLQGAPVSFCGRPTPDTMKSKFLPLKNRLACLLDAYLETGERRKLHVTI
jgi:hypothetical protein